MRAPGFYWVRDAARSEPEVARWSDERWYWATFYDADDEPAEVLSERIMPPPDEASQCFCCEECGLGCVHCEPPHIMPPSAKPARKAAAKAPR
jgi:hypothetical protein